MTESHAQSSKCSEAAELHPPGHDSPRCHGDTGAFPPVLQFRALAGDGAGPAAALHTVMWQLQWPGAGKGASGTQTSSRVWKPAAAGPKETLLHLIPGAAQ